MGEGWFVVVVEIFMIDESFDLSMVRIWNDSFVKNFFLLGSCFLGLVVVV